MSPCNHQKLTLLPGAKRRLQCRHCHLTILEDELGEGYCPECYETEGWKRYDFELIAPGESGEARYRCEECNTIVPYRSNSKPVSPDPNQGA